ncbi:MAG: ATP phosphoribosyltransferase [Clostridia bacterium]|nr:ATP phosphoribosyltransferase [Clostridia bacterium]
MSDIKIAMTKGRLLDETLEIFQKAGFDTTSVKNPGRKLILPMNDTKVVLAKAPDVITYVSSGACDIGIVGKDVILEKGGTFYEYLDLKIGKCQMILAAKDEEILKGYKTKTIATKYPEITASYFSKKSLDVRIIKIEGSVELTPLINLSDAIVDITQTGQTLKENNLIILDKVCDISARLIVNLASLKLKQNEMKEILSKIGAVVN